MCATFGLLCISFHRRNILSQPFLSRFPVLPFSPFLVHLQCEWRLLFASGEEPSHGIRAADEMSRRRWPHSCRNNDPFEIAETHKLFFDIEVLAPEARVEAPGPSYGDDRDQSNASLTLPPISRSLNIPAIFPPLNRLSPTVRSTWGGVRSARHLINWPVWAIGR